MKKLFFLCICILLSISVAYAFDINTQFGIKQQETAEGYQQYVGQTFFVRPAYGNMETWKKSGFKYTKEYDGKIFTITKIAVKEVSINNAPNRKITIFATQHESKRKIKIKGYEDLSIKVSDRSGVNTSPLIGRLPIVFTKPFSEYKQALIGKTVSHKMVKDEYEITDVFIGEDKLRDATIAATNVTVRNKRTSKFFTCPYSKVEIAPFEEALKGSYRTALVKVEKPEDATNRYGETKTIQDDGINKYSYNDSIIDILIFGTEKKFHFVLKNISRHSLKLIWNEAAFVGLDGSTSKIMHAGTKYSQREGDQPASVIIKGAKIEDVATPTENVYYDEGIRIGYSTIGNGWRTRSMLPTEYKGKEAGVIRLMLPIQIKEVVNEYTFVFNVYYSYDHPELLNIESL